MEIKGAELARIIDHTDLRPVASQDDIRKLCQEAIDHGFGAVCVNGSHISLAADKLIDHNIDVCTVVGFPLGASEPVVKALEARRAILLGATEIDMVMNIGALLEGRSDLVLDDIFLVVDAVREATSNGEGCVKVIIETCFLTPDQILEACSIVKRSGARFVKTSTGFGSNGAKLMDIMLMRKTVGIDFGVKAAGGIKALDFALECIEAGANRIGTSSGPKIMAGFNSR